MNKKIILINIIIVSLVGTLSHFAYDKSMQNDFVGLFVPVNESIWEHLKLLFFPTFILSIIEFIICKDCRSGFFASRLLGVVAGMLLIVSAYYTITGVIGKNIDAVNITLFFISVITTFVLSYIIQKNGFIKHKYSNIIAFTVFVLISVIFGIFTNNPPGIGIFDDPEAIKNDTGI